MTPFPSTLRGRLTLWYLSSTAITLALLTLLFGIITWYLVHNQIDHHTHVVALEAKQIVQQYGGGERERLLRNLVSAKGMTIALLTSDGSPVLQTNSSDLALMSEHQLQKIFASAGESPSSMPQHFSQADMRFATTLITDTNGNKGMLAVGYSTEIFETTFQRLLVLLVGTMLLVTLPLGWWGYLLLQRSLQPLEHVAQTAQSISHSDELGKRVRAPQPTAELRAIVTSFNQMLERLQGVFHNEHQFFADAAHGLKTPIALLRARVERLHTTTADKEALLEQVDELVNTIQDLLLVSGLATQLPKKKTSFSLTRLLTGLAELTTTLGEHKRLRMTTNIETGLLLETDPKLVQRLFVSLLHNAVQYSLPDGTISLSARKNKSQDTLTIEVSDTGSGIARRDLPHVFERFFRGENAKNTKGSGLGLAIARTAALRLGGKIRVRSKKGHGTTFSVTLPVSSSLHVG